MIDSGCVWEIATYVGVDPDCVCYQYCVLFQFKTFCVDTCDMVECELTVCVCVCGLGMSVVGM